MTIPNEGRRKKAATVLISYRVLKRRVALGLHESATHRLSLIAAPPTSPAHLFPGVQSATIPSSYRGYGGIIMLFKRKGFRPRVSDSFFLSECCHEDRGPDAAS